MSCRNTQYNKKDTTDGCIIEVVRNIVKAQKQAVEVAGDSCMTSCDSAMQDLLAPSMDNMRPRNTTIPFILYSKGTNLPFFGQGVCRDADGVFQCTNSPIFRAKGFVPGSSNCVRLELLVPADNSAAPVTVTDPTTVCDIFEGGGTVSNFIATGICITVDLNCFCAISCLDAITPVRQAMQQPM